MPVSPSSVRIDLARDANFDDFTLQTFKDRYLVGDETSPQHGFARACAAFADDEAHAQRLYDYVSRQWFMFATPLLSNGGTERGLPISCFLTYAEDSREGIFDHYTEVGWLSSVGGGVGGYWGELRGNGEKTSRGSSSTGIIPFVSVVDRLILAVSQGGTRRGSYAAYNDIFHPEIEEFMTGRKPTGGDANRKFVNLHNAVNITDEFMYAVRDDTTFALRSPKTKKVLKEVSARALWKSLIETRKQTGEPYMFFVDTANRKLPEAQKRRGLKVNQSNLCVGPMTEVLTPVGYMPISTLAGSRTPVWNGETFSEVEVVQTNEPGSKVEMVRVHFQDGGFLDCTPYHKFYKADGEMVRAGLLKEGDVLERPNHPTIDLAHGQTNDAELSSAYAAGYAMFRGFEDKNRLNVFVPGAHQAVMKRLLENSVDADYSESSEGMYIRFEPGTIESGVVPLSAGYATRMSWLAGAIDSAAEPVWTQHDGTFYTILTPDVDLVRSMRLLALECGLHPYIRIGDSHAAFMLPIGEMALMRDYSRVEWTKAFEELSIEAAAEAVPAPMVMDVTPLPWKSDSFCFNEPQRERGLFNGYLTGNCTEITLATGRDDKGKMRTAVCCLSSVNGETYDEWKDHPFFIEDMMRMLDNALQVFIDNAPPELEHAVYSATQERSVGLGLLGFHAYLQKNLVAFESQEARVINKAMFKHIRAQADAASLKLGAERGEAPDMEGTGERFAHKLAIAPNASSSILCRNTSPSIEPFRANAYLHKTLSGSFPVKNPYLVEQLKRLGLDNENVWKLIVGDEGSIQNLGTLDEDGLAYIIDGRRIDAKIWDHLKGVFKTFTEIDMRWVVQLAADRTDEVCQAQSVNLAFPHDAEADYMSEVHYTAWLAGLKSLYYYRSTTPKRAENTNTKVERAKVDIVELPTNTMSANAADDSTCLSCEG